MKLDHVVWFSKRSPEEITSHNKGAVVGGRHEAWGTRNALKYLGNGYVEWLSVENVPLAQRCDNPLVNQLVYDLEAYGEGWGTICFSTEDIDVFNRKLLSRGLMTSGVLNASRRTSSGTLKRWKMLFVQQNNIEELPAPFFIQWEQDENTRMTTLRNKGDVTEDSESECIQECIFASKNASVSARQWMTILDIPLEENQEFTFNGIRFRFTESRHDRNRMIGVVTDQTESQSIMGEEGV